MADSKEHLPNESNSNTQSQHSNYFVLEQYQYLMQNRFDDETSMLLDMEQAIALIAVNEHQEESMQEKQRETKTSADSSKTIKGIWSWNDDGNWKEFDQEASNEIDQQLTNQWYNDKLILITFPMTKGSWFSMEKNKGVYMCIVQLNKTKTAITSIKQLNNKTQYERDLKRTPSFNPPQNYNNQNKNISNQAALGGGGGYGGGLFEHMINGPITKGDGSICWSWKDDTQWREYDDITSKQIETAYNSHRNSVVLTQGPYFGALPRQGQYQIVFDTNSMPPSFYQINTTTHFQTKVERTGRQQINGNNNDDSHNEVQNPRKRSIHAINDNIIDPTSSSLGPPKKRQKQSLNERQTENLWQWKKTDTKWKNYDEKISKITEDLDDGEWHQFKCQDNGQTYKITKISEKKAEQINIRTKFKREIRRITKEAHEVEQRLQKKMKKMEKKIKEYEQKEEDDKKQGSVVIWKWQENENTWKSYDNAISTIIEKLKINDHHQWTFSGNKQTYKITKLSSTTAQQININTNIKRDAKRTKRERGSNNIEYPSWWNMADIDLDKELTGYDPEYAKPKLVTLNLNAMPAEMVMANFKKTCPNRQVIKIESVQNQMLYDSYYNARRKLIKLIGENKLNERDVYHGTRDIKTMGLVQQGGFMKVFSSNAAYGQGTYFARDAKYSVNGGYCGKKDGVYQIFVCKVIMGESHKGKGSYDLKKWPKKDGGKGLIYDSLVNNMENPSIFVIHENVRAYPMFVIHFK